MIFLSEDILKAKAELEAQLLEIKLPGTQSGNIGLLIEKADAVIANSKLVSIGPQWQGYYRMIIRDFFGVRPFAKNSLEYYAAMEDLAPLLQLWALNPTSKELREQISQGLERLGIVAPQE